MSTFTVKTLMEWCKTEAFTRYLPRDVDTDAYAQNVATYFKNQSDKTVQSGRGHPILACSESSVKTALIDIARMGLELGVRPAEVNIQARWNRNLGPNGGAEAEVQEEYRGLLRLIRESIPVKTIHADVVYRNDEFHPNFDGGNVSLVHRPDLLGPRSDNDIVASYVIVTSLDGQCYFAWCDVGELKKREAQGGPVWKKWKVPMCTKSAIRKLGMSGRIPLSGGAAAYVERELDRDTEAAEPEPETRTAADFLDE